MTTCITCLEEFEGLDLHCPECKEAARIAKLFVNYVAAIGHSTGSQELLRFSSVIDASDNLSDAQKLELQEHINAKLGELSRPHCVKG